MAPLPLPRADQAEGRRILVRRAHGEHGQSRGRALGHGAQGRGLQLQHLHGRGQQPVRRIQEHQRADVAVWRLHARRSQESRWASRNS
jgi:hypothetical protein